MSMLPKLPLSFIIGCIVILTATSLHAQNVNKNLLDQANLEFANSEYQAALGKWIEVYKKGNVDPHLMFNIANAYSMLGQRGEAMLFYEKALRYKPFDKDIKHAIQNERNNIQDAVMPINQFFLIKWVTFFLSILRPSYWAFLGLTVLLVALIKWLHDLQVFHSKFIFKQGNPLVFAVAGVLLLMIASLAYKRIYKYDEAIIYSSCETRQGPSTQSPLIRILHPGEKVEIKDEIGEWYRVNFLNLDEAWLKKNCLHIIDPDDHG